MTNHNQQDITLPLDESVAIYARMAAQPQADVSEQNLQVENMVNFARKLGWATEQIAVFEDIGVSGKAPISKRAGLSQLVDTLNAGKIKAIITASENSFFRGADTAELSTFINLCQAHNVILLTPTITYDFSDNAQVQLFRSKFEHAYATLKSVARASAESRKQADTSEE
jgi:DNA invertase Pin-like site-specific DNA recombinase